MGDGAGLEMASPSQKASSRRATTLEVTETRQKKAMRWMDHLWWDEDVETLQQIAKTEA